MPTHISSPPDDRGLSPFTGWTRVHWETQADRLLGGVVPFASDSFARFALPGTPSWAGADSDALEGFSRTFLLAAFRIAGAGGAGANSTTLLERYGSGLAAGTDPAHRDAWPAITGDSTQPMVEAAAIAVALELTRPWLWDALDDRVRDQVATWLGGFVGRSTWPNNWMLFQVVVEEFLASIGAAHDANEIVRGLDALDGWYIGDGWYSDGAGRRLDHYNAWALHFYPLLWTLMAAGGARAAMAAERGALYRDRLRAFVTSFVYLIGSDGAPMHQGRSLTYRFATATPLWMAALFDCSPLRAGQTRRAASGILRHFATNGAPDPRMLLRRGWHGEFIAAAQGYAGPASPYWAGKAFIGLLLPSDHATWTAPEEALPVETSDTLLAIPAAGWLAQGTRADGIVRLHNHGTDGHIGGIAGPVTDDPLYDNLTYSTRTAPQVPARPRRLGIFRVGRRRRRIPPDSRLTLVGPDGGLLARGPIHPVGAAVRDGIGWAASWRSVADGRVESHTVAHGRLEVRVHFVTTERGVGLHDAGHVIADVSALRVGVGRQLAAVARSDATQSAIASLIGFGPPAIAHGAANAMGPVSAFPYVSATHPGGTAVYASCVVLTGEPLDADTAPEVVAHIDGDRVVIEFAADGAPRRFHVEPVPARPTPRRR
jgi:hypothetical protein